MYLIKFKMHYFAEIKKNTLILYIYLIVRCMFIQEENGGSLNKIEDKQNTFGIIGSKG